LEVPCEQRNIAKLSLEFLSSDYTSEISNLYLFSEIYFRKKKNKEYNKT
jgi:hypothetical protein